MGAKTETSKKKGLLALCSSMSNCAMIGDGVGGVFVCVSSPGSLMDFCLLCRTSSCRGRKLSPGGIPR